ncbi:aldo/keto reductase [Flavivirga jejuensis]|uniref:Aldo/keto reductase n=1 Tax=Flavivirga jejuensis TaxID=870487 RepID=A0ABT8WTF8_9FLAO|nr:aldo/keto reductase [Flavivirga jejuensis]MDO5976137.1 aldo/keto reductase [Flavivirga jejuensis]
MNSMNQLGLGTAAIGRPQYINIRYPNVVQTNLEIFRSNGFKLLEEAYNLGVRYFDTAPGYGLAEGLLLEWLQTKNDPAIQVATKWGYTYVANFDAKAKVHEIKEHSLSKLNEQWEVSKTFASNLKVYQIHSATIETGVLKNEAILNRLATLKYEYGLEIGITTTGANQTEVIKKALDVEVAGHALFDAFQVTYNILDQSLETISNELFEQDKKVIIKEALANGRLFKNSNYKHYKELYNTLEKLAETHHVGTDAIALKFCQQNMPKSMVLSGASSSEHLKSNLKVNKVILSKEELRELKRHSINSNNYWQERKLLAWN